MKNAIINGFRLKDILNILDARACISVFTGIGDKAIIGAVSPARVYELLADKEFIDTYGNRDVIGLISNRDVIGLVSFINVTNILIEEA